MKPIVPLAGIAIAALLGGCAVYPDGTPVYGNGYGGGPYYDDDGSGYVVGAPVVTQPNVYMGFGGYSGPAYYGPGRGYGPGYSPGYRGYPDSHDRPPPNNGNNGNNGSNGWHGQHGGPPPQGAGGRPPGNPSQGAGGGRPPGNPPSQGAGGGRPPGNTPPQANGGNGGGGNERSNNANANANPNRVRAQGMTDH
jgi:hypothetical protein